MLREEAEIADEFCRHMRDVCSCLTQINVELRLLRELMELHVLQSRQMTERYKNEKQKIETGVRPV